MMLASPIGPVPGEFRTKMQTSDSCVLPLQKLVLARFDTVKTVLGQRHIIISDSVPVAMGDIWVFHPVFLLYVPENTPVSQYLLGEPNF